MSTLFPMYVSNLHIALDSLFPIHEFCFQSKFIVSNVFCLLSRNHVYHQSTYDRSKYFWNVKMGFEQFTCIMSLIFWEKFFFWKFFFGLFKIGSCSKNPTKYPVFCLITLHYNVNRKNHHYEVNHLTKKIIRWVILYNLSQLNSVQALRRRLCVRKWTV